MFTMKVVIDVNKSVAENAAFYYERAKSAKRKIKGAEATIIKNKILLEKARGKEETVKKKRVIRKKEWYEKFRWFISSEGFLCIGGRDATTNDILIRRYLERNDLVFHTQLAGSPFVLIKNPLGKKIGDQTILEAGQFCAVNSRQWGAGIMSADVYYVKPDQVKKELGLPKGTFMIHGKREYLEPELEIFIGVIGDGRVMAGSEDAVKKNCLNLIKIVPGNVKKSDIAKKIKSRIFQETNLEIDLDDVMQALPPGNCEIK